MKRILVIRNAYDKDMGGAEQYALNLCVALQDEGLKPILMTRVPSLLSKASAEKIQTLRGRWHSTQEWGKHYFIRLPFMVIWYVYVILRYRIDALHPQGRDDFIFASIAGGFLRKPVVWTDHADLKYIMDLENHPFPYLKSWVVFASRFCKAIICVSEAEKAKIEAHAPSTLRKRLVVIHNGVFIPQSVMPIKRVGAEKGSTLIATNARLVPDKGIAELLEGMARLKKDTFLWIVGGYSGNQEKYSQMAKDLGVAEHVKFIGYVNNPHDYIAVADIFVHASYHEAFSLAVIEAAMLGRPIVATSVGGNSEILGDSRGVLIAPKDVNSIVSAINNLMNNPAEAVRMGREVKEYAHKFYDFKKIVKEQVIPLY